MKTTVKVLLAVAALYVGACGQPETAPASAQSTAVSSAMSLFTAEPDLQWRLPGRLREISGLSVSADGRVFGHDDEHAIVYEIDVARGALVKSFSVGDSMRGDFEGLAITPSGDFWLTTSQGRVFRFREGADGARVEVESFDTGLANVCEIEGLAYLASEQSLILACKQHESRAMRGTLALYIWREGAPATLWRSLPERDVVRAAGVSRFRPSSLEIDSQTGRLLLLSARDPALAELSPDGVLLSARALGEAHTQAEGVTVLPDGAMVIADEGGDGRALLSRYPRRP